MNDPPKNYRERNAERDRKRADLGLPPLSDDGMEVYGEYLDDEGNVIKSDPDEILHPREPGDEG